MALPTDYKYLDILRDAISPTMSGADYLHRQIYRDDGDFGDFGMDPFPGVFSQRIPTRTMTANLSDHQRTVKTVRATDFMKPIERLQPSKGMEVMLYCPDEAPEHVAARYEVTEVNGEIAWEGWMYLDEVLRDICPLGPSGATHYYDMPTPATKLAKEVKTRAPRSGERVNKIDVYQDHRFSAQQLIVLYEHDLHPRQVETQNMHYMEMPEHLVSSAENVSPDATIAARPRSVLCPVIERALGRGLATVVMPNGELKQVSF